MFGRAAKSPRVGAAARRLLFGTCLSLAGLLPAAADDYVVISAAAIPQYDRNAVKPAATQQETYVFSPGRHFTAAISDRTDEKATFDLIARNLAPALAEQRYVPSRDPHDADLLIIVHWGTTWAPEPAFSDQILGRLNSGQDLSELMLQIEADAQILSRSIALNADILGYRRSLRGKQHRLFPSEEERTMVRELAEERYFVVLMAYDYKIFKTEKRRHLVWTTHMNVRSAGNNFIAAIPQMAKVASRYFGKDETELVHVFTPLRTPRIEIGETKLVPTS